MTMFESARISSCCPTRRPKENARLRPLLLLIVFPALAYANATASATIYRDSESQSPPFECFKSVRPSYLVDEADDAHQLVIDIPDQVPRQNLSVDIDYNESSIEVFGWWMEQKVRGERPKKMCLYHKWTVEPEFVAEESPGSTVALSLYDIVMGMKGRQLTVSLPMPEEPASLGGSLHDGLGQGDPTPTVTTSDHYFPIKVIEAAKKLRGLARLGSTQNSTLMERIEDKGLLMNEDSADVSMYRKSRQDALERFLKFSLGSNDEESYWLRRM